MHNIIRILMQLISAKSAVLIYPALEDLHKLYNKQLNIGSTTLLLLGFTRNKPTKIYQYTG